MAAIDAAGAAERPPSMVLVLTDDQGYGDLGCFGSTTIRTPHIDRMAREGARLTCFYAAAPICTPTRAALMTGNYANRSGLTTPLHVFDEIGVAEAEVTLAETLQESGYRTACIGKWHLGHVPRYYPTRHGFDVYWGTPLGHMFNRPAVGKAVGDTSDLFLDGEQPIEYPPVEQLTEQLTEAAVDFIRGNRHEPFFLLLAHSMPHEPLAASEPFAGRSAGGLYGDVIETIDWSTGQILAALDQHGLTDRTIVLFTSDNGPKLGEGSAAPLRGGKHQPYEGGVRVPCVAYAPGRIPPGTTIEQMVTMMDLYPTLAALAGANVPAGQVIDGRNVSSLLLGEPAATQGGEEFFYFVRHGKLAGMRHGRWKLLLQTKDEPELFDLLADAAEQHNVADRHPGLVAQLTKRMRQFERSCQRRYGE